MLGRVESLNPLEIRWNSGRVTVVDTQELEKSIEVSYISSVHKVQGSQAPLSIYVLFPSSYQNQDVLYTAITRAQNEAVVIASNGKQVDDLRRAKAPVKINQMRERLCQQDFYEPAGLQATPWSIHAFDA